MAAQQPKLEYRAENRIVTQLAAGKVIGETAGPAIGGGGLREQGLAQRFPVPGACQPEKAGLRRVRGERLSGYRVVQFIAASLARCRLAHYK